MKLSIVISVLVVICSICQVYGACPRIDELDCSMYEHSITHCPQGGVTDTFIMIGNKKCLACQVCIRGSGKHECSKEKCPYKRIEDFYPMDCGIQKYQQKRMIKGKMCDACATFTIDCSDLSWIG